MTGNRWLYPLILIGLLLQVSTPHSVLAGFRNSKVRVGNALAPKKFAMLVGIPNSLKTHAWPKLRYAYKDVNRMARTLRTQGQFDRILKVTSTQNTSKKGILSALNRLKSWVKHPNDIVLVYFSAHGTVSRKGKRYIITSDTSKHITKTALSVESLQAKLAAISSRRIGLILATCYNGGSRSKSVMSVGMKGGVKARPFKQVRAIQILSAASYAQPAFESQELQSDVYTHFFLDCFSRVKRKTIINLHVCAANLTTPYVKKMNGDVQVPKAYSRMGANRDFSLAKGTQPKLVGYFLSSWKKQQGVSFKIRPQGRKGSTASGIRSSSGEMIALAPGRYHVELRGKDNELLRKKDITILSGSITQIQEGPAWSIHGNYLFTNKGLTSYLTGISASRHHPMGKTYQGARLSILGNSQSRGTGTSYTNLYIEFRSELGAHTEWAHHELYYGGFLGGGFLFLNFETEFGPEFTFTITTGGIVAYTYWIKPTIGLLLQMDLGISATIQTDLPKSSRAFTLYDDPMGDIHLSLEMAINCGVRFRW